MKTKKPERVCLVPSCGAVLKKGESGVCTGCESVIDSLNGSAWISGWGPR